MTVTHHHTTHEVEHRRSATNGDEYHHYHENNHHSPDSSRHSSVTSHGEHSYNHHKTYYHRPPDENEPILYPDSKPRQSMEDRAQKCCDPFYISCFLLLLGFGCGTIGGYLYFKNGGGTQSMLGYVAAGGILVFLVGVYIMYEYTKVCLCCHRGPDA